MRNKNFYFLLVLLLISCSNPTSSPDFIQEVSGRYLYNADNAIEVYFKKDELFLKWNKSNHIKPMIVGDATFYVKEMNEKIQFLTNPEDGLIYICFLPKTDGNFISYKFRKLDSDEKLPSEYFYAKKYNKARDGYLAIMKRDSLNPIIKESKMNRWGYNEIKKKNYDVAKEIFAINIALHPNSSNVYDSYGESLYFIGDTINAITYFKKSLSMDSGNRNAEDYLKRLDKKQKP